MDLPKRRGLEELINIRRVKNMKKPRPIEVGNISIHEPSSVINQPKRLLENQRLEAKEETM